MEPKTIEQIIKNSGHADEYHHNLIVVPFDDVIMYMKMYANAKLDEAKFNVSLRETESYTTSSEFDHGFLAGINEGMESIELLKESV